MPDAASPPDLVERLRRVAEQDHICTGSTDCEHCTGDCLCSYFSPEQVAAGLEAMRGAVVCEYHLTCDPDARLMFPAISCDACWSSMLDAFLQAAGGEGRWA